MTVMGEAAKFNCLIEREGDIMHTDKMKQTYHWVGKIQMMHSFVVEQE
jgi:hypothetical protein